MATVNMTLISERWLDECTLFGSITNADGDQDNVFVPPAGFGDCALMELLYYGGNISTMVTNPELQAVRVMIESFAGSAVDIVGVEYFKKVGNTNLRVATYLSPDPLVLIRQGERIQIIHPEVDTNATAAVDIQVYAKVVRIRPTETTGAPLQLVR